MNLYIFYIHNTITEEQAIRAIDSIPNAVPKDELFDLCIWNTSNNIDVEFLKKYFWAISYDGNGFKYQSLIIPAIYDGGSVAADVMNQIKILKGYDNYICHKADFYLTKNSIKKALHVLNFPMPRFINFSKFDVRENVSFNMIQDLSYFNFEEIMEYPAACDMTHGTPDDFGIQYEFMGYRGIDGVMHAYNDRARQLLTVDSYWEQYSVNRNIENGVQMIHGLNDVLALHMFHELPGGRGSYLKNIEGYRF